MHLTFCMAFAIRSHFLSSICGESSISCFRVSVILRLACLLDTSLNTLGWAAKRLFSSAVSSWKKLKKKLIIMKSFIKAKLLSLPCPVALETHCFCILLKWSFKNWSHINFHCPLAFLEIHRKPKQKEFLKSCEGFLRWSNSFYHSDKYLDGVWYTLWIKSMKGTFTAPEMKSFGPPKFKLHAGVKKCHFGNFSDRAVMAVPY